QTDNVAFLPFNDEEALTRTFQDSGEEILTVIIEGIQGVGGIREASVSFLKAIRSLCDKYGAVFIAVAVQCGCGRTGDFYSQDHAGVDADIYSMAKGMGNGFPIRAISISPKFKASFAMLGTTFGGNHLACAAAIAVSDVMKEENLLANIQNVGQYFLT